MIRVGCGFSEESLLARRHAQQLRHVSDPNTVLRLVGGGSGIRGGLLAQGAKPQE